MNKSIDLLIESIINLKSPIVVGLDPVLKHIPQCYKLEYLNRQDKFAATGELLYEYNRDIIDNISDIVPAVKPQMAFYEMYGSYGILAFEKTIEYAKSKGLIVIEDGKRNDIGNTADAYAKAHLGKVLTLDNEEIESFNVDFLTVSPYLGSDSITPFINEAITNNKGLFVLVKTSNHSGREIQDFSNSNGTKLYEEISKYLDNNSELLIGKYGYSALGAVVGATYPDEAKLIRNLMPKNIFLVPGYGAQGGSAKDIVNCFNEDGLGAIVNSSRGILYSYEETYDNSSISKQDYLQCVRNSVLKMKSDIVSELRNHKSKMMY